MQPALLQTLRKLYAQEGESLLQDIRRLRAFLEDYHPHETQELNLLILAAQEQIPYQLLNTTSEMMAITVRRCAQQLCDKWGLQLTHALDAVESWHQVLYPFTVSKGTRNTMPYSAQINRANPTCFLFLVDQSSSMSEPFGGNPEGIGSKAEQVALTANRLFQELIVRCSKPEVYRYFKIGVIGYGSRVGPILGGKLSGQEMVWIDEIAENPMRVEQRTKKISDGAGSLVEVSMPVPLWFEPVANGMTPMHAAFQQAKVLVQQWIEEHPASYPPVIINITDGDYTDSEPSSTAEEIREMATRDGAPLIFNVHLSSNKAKAAIRFPSSEENLPDQFARTLFHMSSELPGAMREFALSKYGFRLESGSRGFIFNADAEHLVYFLDIGTSTN
jgi:hypothetical protein